MSEKVHPWFNTDTYFNRTLFADAVGGFNPDLDTYDLHLAAAGSSTLNRWVSYHIKQRIWTGPHVTAKFTPTYRGLLRDDAMEAVPTIGGSDMFLYKMNQSGATDVDTAIAIDWITKFLAADTPDITKVWLEPTFHVKRQGATPQPLVVTPRIGALDASNGTAQNISQAIDRSRLARLGVGRFLRLQFTHSTNAEDVDLRGLELPYVEAGRR